MACGSAAAIVAALALLAATSPLPPPVTTPIDPGTAESLRLLVGKDLRVATIAFRLQTAAADHCPDHTRLSGLIVQDASQYSAALRPALAVLYGMTDLPTVTAVVKGSPAAAAGIGAGDAIVAVDGFGLAADLPMAAGRAPDGRRFTAMIDRLDTAFAAGPATLVLRRADQERTVTVTGATACRSAVQLDLSDRRNASADGHVVTVTQGIADFTPSDDELAFVIGHELAHDILGHRAYLDGTHTSRGMVAGLGGNGARLRATERQADYFGVYLLAWAGYDPHAAAHFWRRMAHADPLGSLFADGTHPGYGARVRALARAADEIDAERAAGRPVVPDGAAFAAAVG